MKDICSEATKAIIRAFKMGGMSNSYQHRIVSFSFTIAGSFSINDGNGNDKAIN